MLAVLHPVLVPLARSWQRLSSSGVAIIFVRGRDALLGRAEARTEMEKLAVEEKRHQLAKQRANDVIDLMLKVQKIKDPQLREKAKTAILASGQIPLPQDGPAE